jgi:hypothetical protein
VISALFIDRVYQGKDNNNNNNNNRSILFLYEDFLKDDIFWACV